MVGEQAMKQPQETPTELLIREMRKEMFRHREAVDAILWKIKRLEEKRDET